MGLQFYQPTNGEILIYGQRPWLRPPIAHRLFTVQHTDKIAVLAKGKLVEKGIYQELLQRKGL
ncbi:MAG TPA: hypothetical protein GXZ98_05800 [Firmicutes bacterium]|jgi:hypothetical protein|nr:hypothetical protein [Bacillota bacterium]